MGGQISWLIPFATIALIAGLILRGRAPRTDARRAALMLWGGWFVLHYLTFALAEGTFHPYYVTAMAPGIAALAGAGGVTLYRAFREGSAAMGVPPARAESRAWGRGWVLPAAVAASAAWAIVLLQRVSGSGTRYTVAEIVVGVAGTVAVLGLLAGRFTRREGLIGFAALAAVVALLAGPAAYSVSAATSATNGTNPTAGPSTGGGWVAWAGVRAARAVRVVRVVPAAGPWVHPRRAAAPRLRAPTPGRAAARRRTVGRTVTGQAVVRWAEAARRCRPR
ncbi:hypothetical protein ACFROD_14165 [Streptomyces mirabilis]|uniref:hypothetical protein n=1 Tax=Streptomyces mirabilis TaxID=68239 RepID=UPI003682D753